MFIDRSDSIRVVVSVNDELGGQRLGDTHQNDSDNALLRQSTLRHRLPHCRPAHEGRLASFPSGLEGSRYLF
jgi:hypothetical protein